MSFVHLNENWQELTHDPTARGVFLVVIGGAGTTYFVSTRAAELYDDSGKPVQFVDAILNQISFREEIDVYSRAHNFSGFRFDVDLSVVKLDELRRQGVMLELLNVDVYWGVLGQTKRALDQAFHLVSGTMSNPKIDVEKGRASFEVEDRVNEMLENDAPFPPVSADNVKLTNLNSEDFGKVYPVIFGEVDKVPIIENSSGAGTSFLTMTDKIGDITNPLSAMYVADGADIYAGAGAAQAAAADAAGNVYWGADPDTAAGTDRRVTADVTGHASDTPGDIIRDLITFYSDHSDIVDLASLNRLVATFKNTTMGVAFNDRVNGGVFQAIRDRIARVVPFVTVQRGGKISFIPLTWDREPVKRLSTDTNIIRKVSPAAETSRRNIRNAFFAKFNRSGYRGDAQGFVERDHTNNLECLVSKNMVGSRPAPDMDLGDLKDSGSALTVVDWHIETFTKVRTKVSYECTADVVDVHMWDTVQVHDAEEGWDHWPLFKVVGKTYQDGPGIVLNLLSRDAYVDVYNVNRWND